MTQINLDTIRFNIKKTDVLNSISGKGPCNLLIGKSRAIEMAKQTGLKDSIHPWRVYLFGLSNNENQKPYWNVRATYQETDKGDNGEEVNVELASGTAKIKKWANQNFPEPNYKEEANRQKKLDAEKLEAKLKLQSEQSLIHFSIKQIDSICSSIDKTKDRPKPKYDFNDKSGRTDVAQPIQGSIIRKGKNIGNFSTSFRTDMKSNDFIKVTDRRNTKSRDTLRTYYYQYGKLIKASMVVRKEKQDKLATTDSCTFYYDNNKLIKSVGERAKKSVFEVLSKKGLDLN